MIWRAIAVASLLGLLGLGNPGQDAKPTPEQSKFLAALRTTALQYTEYLPNFICTQTTHRTVSGNSSFAGGMTGVSTGGRGVLGMPTGIGSTGDDTIEEHLTFFDHSEHY